MSTYTHIEVGPDGSGGWRVVAHYHSQPFVTNRLLGRYRLKRTAVLVGRGAAMALHTELRVKNRKGQYTKAAASHGNDPRRSKG